MKKETVFVRALIALLLVAAVLTGCSQLSAPVAADAAAIGDSARATRVNLKDKAKNNVIYVTNN